jgi:hypothetical protein
MPFRDDTLKDQYRQLIDTLPGFVMPYAGIRRYGLYRPDPDKKFQLTRLHTATIPDQDPLFIPAPDMPEVDTNLRELIDPVYYYGCTTETLYNPEFEHQLPQDRVYVNGVRAYAPLPAGYTLYSTGGIYAIAPEGLTGRQAVNAAYGQNLSFPVIGLDRFRVPYVDDLFSMEKVPDVSLD